MNILHVVNIYFVLPYFIGDQFIYFNRKGYRQYVVCSPSEHLDNYARKMGFGYRAIGIAREINIVKDIAAVYKICRYIRQNKIDIVVGHTPKGALLAMIAATLMRIRRRIYFRHGLVYETMKGFKRLLMVKMDRLTALLATRIVVVSPSLARQSLEDRLNDAGKQIILGKGTCGGIDAISKFNPGNIDHYKLIRLKEKLGILPETFVIGYCGRIVRDKGIGELVNAFEIIKDKTGKELKLLLVGEFEKRDALSPEIIDKIKTDRDIIQTGFIFDDIEYYYSLFNLYILPSYREGFPISVLEASAMQLPVLTTRATGCIDSIIEGETGIFIENTADGIAEGIMKLMMDQASVKLGINGRKFVLENFDHSKIWPVIEEKIYSAQNSM